MTICITLIHFKPLSLIRFFPGSSVHTTCILLKRCGVTCGGGLETSINTKPNNSQECATHESSGYSEYR